MPHKNVRLGCAGLVMLLSHALQAAPACVPASVEKGAAVFAAECAACHAVKHDVRGLMGPHLAGLAGRISGSLPGFSYSEAMKSKALAWDPQSIAAFLAQPQSVVPGTYMPYAGMADAASRDDVVCFLGQQH